MSPILVRPVREQLEHDRVIRLLQVKLKRKHDVTANIGEDQSTPVKIGQLQIYPDLLLTSTDRGHKLMGTVEVETSESINHLEARSQWAHLGRARAPFHLYVPTSSLDIARRLAAENQVNVTELWTYHTIGDQTIFKLAQKTAGSESRSAEARSPEARAARPSATASKVRTPARQPAPAAAARSKNTKARSAALRGPKSRASAPVRRSAATPRRASSSRKTGSPEQSLKRK